jgi:hypothetical protein
LHNLHYSNHYIRLLFYLLWLADCHFSQVKTLDIQHADGANATNGTPSFLEQVGVHRFPQELSREHNVGAGEGRTETGGSHYQAWPGIYRIHSHEAAGLWPPPERVALVSGMLCTVGNEFKGGRLSRLLAQRPMRENEACMHKSGKYAGQNCTCDPCNLER